MLYIVSVRRHCRHLVSLNVYCGLVVCPEQVFRYSAILLADDIVSEYDSVDVWIQVSLQECTKFTYFSLKFRTSELNFSEHISFVCKKASQQIGVLRRLRKLIPTHAKLLLYKAAILPHLTYCSIIWHFCRASDKRKVERLQERALNVV